jgi:hypothetical protein
VIQLCFDTEEQRLRWVGSEEHQDAFPKISALCTETAAIRYDIIESKD